MQIALAIVEEEVPILKKNASPRQGGKRGVKKLGPTVIPPKNLNKKGKSTSV